MMNTSKRSVPVRQLHDILDDGEVLPPPSANPTTSLPQAPGGLATQPTIDLRPIVGCYARRACHVVREPCGRCRRIGQPQTPPPPSLKRRAAKEGTAQARFRRCAPASGTAGQTSRVAPSLTLGLLCAPCPLAAPSALAGVSIASAPLGLRPRPQRRRHRYRAGATVFVGYRAKMRRGATPLAGSSRWRAAGLRLRATRVRVTSSRRIKLHRRRLLPVALGPGGAVGAVPSLVSRSLVAGAPPRSSWAPGAPVPSSPRLLAGARPARGPSRLRHIGCRPAGSHLLFGWRMTPRPPLGFLSALTRTRRPM